jgi:hypothetical protein
MSGDPLYLQVRNRQGELVGLMRGPFPLEWLRRGVVSFAVTQPVTAAYPSMPDAALGYRRIDLRVNYWVAEGATEAYAVLEDGGLELEDLRQIGKFR